jgi:hypothetical protein
MGHWCIESLAPKWDSDLEVFIWLELPGGLVRDIRESRWYIMDKEGRYRFWRSGWYVGKIPRENKEDRQGVEE